MTSIADGLVKIQTTPESNISTPSWFGEVVVISRHLNTHGVLSKINEQVRGCRGSVLPEMSVIDFLAVQIALRHQRRAHPGGVLPAAPAVCHPIHGPVWA